MNECKLIKKVPVWPLWLLLFTSTDTLIFGTNSIKGFLFVPRIVGLLFVLMIPFILKEKIKIGKKTIVLFILVMIAFVSAYVNKMEILTILSRIISIIVAYSIATNYNHKTYIKVFSDFIFFVSVVAIITEVFAYTYPTIFTQFPTLVNTADYKFSAFFVGSMRYDFLENTLIRAEGIFWEPGAFSIYLNLAIMYELFFQVRIRYTRLIVMIISLFLTFSTTGYIGFFVMLVVYIVGAGHPQAKKTPIKRIVLGVIMLALVMGIVGFRDGLIYEIVFDKIKNSESTAITRYSSIVNGLEIAWNNPLWGVGSNKIRESMIYYASRSSFGENPMLTNTCIMQFATFGMIFGGIYFYYTAKYFFKQGLSLISRIGLLITLLLLYCGETFYSFLPFIFVFYGIDSREQELVNENCVNQFTA